MASQMIEVLKSFPKFDDPKCVGTEDMFFPESMHSWEKRTPMLRMICNSCSHKVECLNYALENIIEEGFWGGMTPEERKKIQTKEKQQNKRYREIQEYLSLGLNEDELAEKLQIKKASLKRVILRAKRKGLIQ
jgi:hypothetical protein